MEDALEEDGMGFAGFIKQRVESEESVIKEDDIEEPIE